MGTLAERTLITLRFVDFVGDDHHVKWDDLRSILVYAKTCYPWVKMRVVSTFIAELFADSLRQADVSRFSLLVAEHVPLVQWHTSAVYLINRRKPDLLVLDMDAFFTPSTDDVIEAFTSCLLQTFHIGEDVYHTVGLVLQVRVPAHLDVIEEFVSTCDQGSIASIHFHLSFSKRMWSHSDPGAWEEDMTWNIRLILRTLTKNTRPASFWTPWYNQGHAKSLDDSMLYLTVHDRLTV
jgi:hypothetical protein